MKAFQLQFTLRVAGGELRPGTQVIAAESVTLAIMRLQSLPLPGVIEGPIGWTELPAVGEAS